MVLPLLESGKTDTINQSWQDVSRGAGRGERSEERKIESKEEKKEMKKRRRNPHCKRKMEKERR